MLPGLLEASRLRLPVLAEQMMARKVTCGGARSGALLQPLFSRGLKGLSVPNSRSYSSSNGKAEEEGGGQRPSTARLVVTHSR